jgi:hypothetical protein
MELKIEVYGCLCELKEFVINGIDANYDDFGSKGDEDSENAEDYGCGDMRFTGSPSTKEILDKYKITEEEYQEIVSKLEDALSFGSCGWCV